MKVTEELRKLRKRAGLSMAELATALGYKTPSGYQRYENEEKFTKPYLPLLLTQKLASALEGRGNPPIDVNEVIVLSGMPGDTFEDRYQFSQMAMPYRIPVIPLDQLYADVLENATVDEKRFIEKTVADGVGKDAFCVEVTDDSMSSYDKNQISIDEGDRVICVPSQSIKPGDFVIAHRQGDDLALLRRYRITGFDEEGQPIVDLVPLNPNYPALSIKPGTAGRIIARVKELRKTF